MPSRTLLSALSAELIGTFLFITVGGAAVVSDAQTGGAVGLLGISVTFGFVIAALATAFGPISGAHFNPAVSLVMAWRKALPLHLLAGYVVAQLLGAALGAWLAHAMFELPILQWSAHVRTGPSQWLAEAVATAGLLFVILRSPPGKASALVACYIGAAYWFTASTSFTNPAAVFGRMLSDTFAGIDPSDALGFVASQLVGAALGWLLHHVLSPPSHPS